MIVTRFADGMRVEGVTVSTVHRVEQWLSDLWSADLLWPSDIPRPARRAGAERVEAAKWHVGHKKFANTAESNFEPIRRRARVGNSSRTSTAPLRLRNLGGKHGEPIGYLRLKTVSSDPHTFEIAEVRPATGPLLRSPVVSSGPGESAPAGSSSRG